MICPDLRGYGASDKPTETSTTAYGGEAIRSPLNVEVPNSGHWFVVLDLGGRPRPDRVKRARLGAELLDARWGNVGGELRQSTQQVLHLLSWGLPVECLSWAG